MKKNYQFPEITLLALAAEDVIATSALNLVEGDVFIDPEDKVSFNNFK